MVGALLVLVGMISSFWGGVVLLVEANAPAYRAIPTPPSADMSLLLLGVAVTLAGGITLLLPSARRLA